MISSVEQSIRGVRHGENRPDLIILDEPTTGLDPQGIVEIRNLILRLKNEQNKTILLSSHQLSEIELIANRMVIISQGRSIVEGSVTELLNTQELLVRIEVDNAHATAELLQKAYPEAIFKINSESELEVTFVKELVPELARLLVSNNINVHAIEPTRKLEDYFMKIIQA
jgi:ABC-2 type transport system ATP-binding protein